jgi:hypothetical protein
MGALFRDNTRRMLTVLALVAVPAVTFVGSSDAYAVLGGDITSIQSDRTQMHGTVQLKHAGEYAVHEIQASRGRIVREYVSARGRVFAVTWHGPSHPDFRQLLGGYFDQFQSAIQQARRERRPRGPVLIELPGFVIQSGGHMRGFFGKAYLPDRVPQGVAVDDLQ